MRTWLVLSLLLTTLSMQQSVVGAALMRLDKAALQQQVFTAEQDFAAFQRYVAVDTVFFDGVSGRFNSIWRRQRDGRWLVVFDKGSPVCAPPPAKAS